MLFYQGEIWALPARHSTTWARDAPVHCRPWAAGTPAPVKPRSSSFLQRLKIHRGYITNCIKRNETKTHLKCNVNCIKLGTFSTSKWDIIFPCFPPEMCSFIGSK